MDATRETLKGLLEEVRDGKIQVPEFQRDFVLDDDWIRSLLASVSLGYPIGAVTLLRAGNPDVRFDSHPISGAPLSAIEPERLLLDGQQRMAALYRVLASGQIVQTQGDHHELLPRWYYLDIKAALDPSTDRDAAIISAPEGRQVEAEWERCLFPLRLVFGDDGAELRHWQRGFAMHGAIEEADHRDQVMSRFAAEVLEAFDTYVVPTIVLGEETARWSVRVHGGPEGRSLSDRFRATE